MNDPKSLSSVKAFHRLFNHPVLDEPSIPDPSRCRLRIALLREELDELEEAINKEDIVGVADALCDLQYVLSGAVLEFGLGYRFKELFDEVQRSNMSKACQTREEAEATLRHYRAKGVSCYYEEKDGVYLVYREGDKKTLKSISYIEADLAMILGH